MKTSKMAEISVVTQISKGVLQTIEHYLLGTPIEDNAWMESENREAAWISIAVAFVLIPLLCFWAGRHSEFLDVRREWSAQQPNGEAGRLRVHRRPLIEPQDSLGEGYDTVDPWALDKTKRT